MNFIGIDPSLTSTGIAVITSKGTEVASFGSPSPKKGEDTLEFRLDRLNILKNKLMDFIPTSLRREGAVIAIESPAYSSNMGKAWDRAGWWWMVVHTALECGFTVVEVKHNSRAKYATGKGNAGKDEVIIAVTRAYPDIDFTNNDEADALVLAAMVARLYGEPIESDGLPQIKLHALDTLTKP